MDINYIIAENVKSKDLETILMNLSNMYSNTGFTDIIQLYEDKVKKDNFLILFNNVPDFDRFGYFVNYIKYPEGFKNLNAKVLGFFKMSNIPRNIEAKNEEWLMFYVSKNDTEYDNVNVVTENNLNYKFDFGGKIKHLDQIEQKFKRNELNKADYNLLIEIIPSKKAEENEIKPWWKFW